MQVFGERAEVSGVDGPSDDEEQDGLLQQTEVLPTPVAAKESLLAAAAKARKEQPAETEAERRLKEEQDMLRSITQRTALKSVKELAKVRANTSTVLINQENLQGAC